jgi:hypothetical protein
MAVVCRISDILGKNSVNYLKPPVKTGGSLFFFALGTQFGPIDFIDKTVGYFHYRCYFVRDFHQRAIDLAVNIPGREKLKRRN